LIKYVTVREIIEICRIYISNDIELNKVYIKSKLEIEIKMRSLSYLHTKYEKKKQYINNFAVVQ